MEVDHTLCARWPVAASVASTTLLHTSLCHPPTRRQQILRAHLTTHHTTATSTGSSRGCSGTERVGRSSWLPWEIPAAALLRPQPAQSLRTPPEQHPLARLARHEVPALVVRNLLSKESCSQALCEIARRQAFGSDFLDAIDLPPGTLSSDVGPADEGPDAVKTFPGDGRIGARGDGSWEGQLWYIGTSFGRLANKNRQSFFEESKATNQFFADAWQSRGGRSGRAACSQQNSDPLSAMQHTLAALSGWHKRASVAVEPDDGSAYGAAILRCYKPMAQCHALHFDSVRQVSMKRSGGVADWEVGRFETQLAAVLLLNAPDESSGKVNDATLFRCEGGSEYANELRRLGSPALRRQAATRRRVDVADVTLGVGDMYVFKADALHEVPGFGGTKARVVLASFVAYSRDRSELMCWA